MSPTLLEFVIVFVLIGLGWRIGIELAPPILEQLRTAKRQLDHLENSLPAKQDEDQ